MSCVALWPLSWLFNIFWSVTKILCNVLRSLSGFRPLLLYADNVLPYLDVKQFSCFYANRAPTNFPPSHISAIVPCIIYWNITMVFILFWPSMYIPKIIKKIFLTFFKNKCQKIVYNLTVNLLNRKCNANIHKWRTK